MYRVGSISVVALFFLFPWNTAVTMDQESLAEAIIGDWEWVYRADLPIMQPGENIQYRIRRGRDGSLTGTAWSDDRELAHLRITRVEISAGLVRFVHPARNHYYEGRMAEDGLSISGSERHHSQIDAMDLARVDFER